MAEVIDKDKAERHALVLVEAQRLHEVMVDKIKTARDHLHFVMQRDKLNADDLSDIQTAYDALRLP